MASTVTSIERPRVVVITGATGAVGRATAHAFARRGDSVGLIGRGLEALESAGLEVDQLGAHCAIAPCDVANANEVEDAADTLEKALGPIDLWINNSTAAILATVQELTSAEVRRVTETTYLGAVHGTMSALRRMRTRDAGTIIQVGSARGYRAIPLQSAYAGARQALRGFTESLRSELVKSGSNVRLAMVHLPALQPEAAAEMILYSALITRATRTGRDPSSSE